MAALKGKRVLVTGGSGFLGRHVVSALRNEGVSGIVAPRSRDCDLRQRDAVDRLFEEVRPEVVFHLAAEVGGIGANRESPGSFFYSATAMGIHVLEASRLYGVEKAVLAGTVCSYPKVTSLPFREEALWEGYPEQTNAAYGIAKKALLAMAQAYRQQYGCNFVTLLPTNLYGPGDNFDLATSHVIPAMIRKFSEANEAGRHEVTLWGDGSPTRDFLYVEDCARAFLLAATKYDDPEPVNIGSGLEVSMAELAGRIADRVGFTGRVVWDEEQPNGQPRRLLDITRARRRLGFEPRTHFEEGLRRTIEWYLQQRPA